VPWIARNKLVDQSKNEAGSNHRRRHHCGTRQQARSASKSTAVIIAWCALRTAGATGSPLFYWSAE
jgi:hypothetical protein